MLRGPAPLLVALALLVPPLPALAADPEPAPEERLLPFGGAWARARGVKLPEPFGVGVFVVGMRRDLEVTDVRVTLPGAEPVSVSDVASFAVYNETTLAAVKLDAWILPVLNVYVLAGHTWTDGVLDATVTVDRLLPGQPDLVLELTQPAKVDGPLLGAGATLVAGYGPWFVLADANYSFTKLEVMDGGIAAVFVSGRTGWSGATSWGGWRGWVGAAYLGVQETLTVKEQTEAGEVVIEVDQGAVNPWTAQAGGGVSIGRHWELMVELGSNFGDAFVGVFSGAYRF